MSALAQVLHDIGYEVQGSDIDKVFFTQKALEEAGIRILPFQKENIHSDMYVILGNAYPDTHEEIQRAKELGVPVVRYHQFLGDFIKNYTSVAVTGAHGKTSTTGLLAHVMKGIRPTSYLIGDGTGFGDKDGEYFVFEACEYRRHFLSYSPDYCIMTNIDFDHPDYFSNIEDVFAAFQEMALQVQKGIIACGDDEYLQKIQAKVPVVYYGFADHNDFQAKIIEKNEEGTTFEVYVRNTYYDTFKIRSYGDHNVLNALAVIALCHYEDFDAKIVKQELLSFRGVKRRFSESVFGSQVLIDDYAHHPTEIRATIDASRQKYPNRTIVAVFQPHTFTRTQTFLEEFAESLRQADHVYLCDIFGSARESNGNLSIENLAELIPDSKIIEESQTEILKEHKDSVILFMGAGDIQKFQQAYENYLKESM